MGYTYVNAGSAELAMISIIFFICIGRGGSTIKDIQSTSGSVVKVRTCGVIQLL